MSENFFKDTLRLNDESKPEENNDEIIKEDEKEYNTIFDNSEFENPTTSIVDVFHIRLKINPCGHAGK